MGGDNQRQDRFGTPVNNFIHALESKFEGITCVVSVLYPVHVQDKEHYDGSNHTAPGYTWTGCMILEDAKETVYIFCKFQGISEELPVILYIGALPKSWNRLLRIFLIIFLTCKLSYEGKVCRFHLSMMQRMSM